MPASPRPPRAWPRPLIAAVAVIAFGFWVAAASVSWFAWSLARDLPNRETLRSIGDMAQSTTLFDAHDRPVFTIYKEQRIEVPLDRISPHLVRALVSMEDQRYYEHRGVDTVRVLRRDARQPAAGPPRAGREHHHAAAGQTELSHADKTFARKFKEILVAAQLERTYSKQEILELYLNKVYFGDGLYGAEAASLGYFGEARGRSFN